MEPALAKLTARDHGLLLALREHVSLGFAPRDVAVGRPAASGAASEMSNKNVHR